MLKMLTPFIFLIFVSQASVAQQTPFETLQQLFMQSSEPIDISDIADIESVRKETSKQHCAMAFEHDSTARIATLYRFDFTRAIVVDPGIPETPDAGPLFPPAKEAVPATIIDKTVYGIRVENGGPGRFVRAGYVSFRGMYDITDSTVAPDEITSHVGNIAAAPGDTKNIETVVVRKSGEYVTFESTAIPLSRVTPKMVSYGYCWNK